ncbi:hypothetical protein GGH92_010140 [Coemansia sp. RSA 2673]|nr:hypothetical protein GGH92_010140 [Coemansia sp. RSA 2673]
MKFSSAATCAALALGASAIPTRHNARPPTDAAPVAFADAQAANLYPFAPQAAAAPAVPANSAADARAERADRKEERRKEWQEWARQQGENGASNGSNFVAQVLEGVSGIVDSALGPVYSFLGQ